MSERMKYYTGIDIIEVERIQENIEKYGEKFLNKIYTAKEIEYCESKKVHKYEAYAGRFAGKEAVFKAVSPLLNSKFDIDWKDIEILNNESGRPYVNVQLIIEKMKDAAKKSDVQIDISISHLKSIACAEVFLGCF